MILALDHEQTGQPSCQRADPPVSQVAAAANVGLARNADPIHFQLSNGTVPYLFDLKRQHHRYPFSTMKHLMVRGFAMFTGNR